jgi:TolA-binding protein
VLARGGCDFYVAVMKFAAFSRSFFAVALPAWLCLATPAQGLNVDAEEFKRLQGEVADLRDANMAYQKRINELTRRIEKLQEDVREANDRSTMKMGDLATREELKKIIDRIAEVDEKREHDRKVILEEFEKLGKTISSAALSGSRSNPRGNNREREREQPDKETKPEIIEGKFLEYKVKPDETFGEIIQEYNAYLKSEGRPTIRNSDVVKVNPNLNPNRIFAGQMIRLPVPDKK